MSRRPLKPGFVGLAATVEGEALPALVTYARKRIDRRPRVVVSHAAAEGVPGWGITPFIKATFAHADVRAVRLADEADAMPTRVAREMLLTADVVLLGPGCPVLAARRVVESGADAWLRETVDNGAAVIGVSAGAIVLGEWWARWPAVPLAGHRFEGGTPIPCARVAPGLVVDCHDEQDGWGELALVHEMVAEGAVQPCRALGLPTGSGIIAACGRTKAIGPIVRFPSRPGGSRERARVPLASAPVDQDCGLQRAPA